MPVGWLNDLDTGLREPSLYDVERLTDAQGLRGQTHASGHSDKGEDDDPGEAHRFDTGQNSV